MRLKEFSIIRYGPLPSTGRILLDDFNFFFGRNEDGKTLTIDAFVKLLLGRSVKDFEHIDRVEEDPEGYVMIEDDEGIEIKLSGKGNITGFTGLTPSECRNIFVIRDSDLSIAPESEFYTHVIDRLTGLRTEEIGAIKKKLQELGRLTRADSTAVLSDREEFGGIKSRVESARRVLERIGELQQSIKVEKLDALEEHVVHQRGEIERISQEIELLEDARKREKYEKGTEVLNRLKEIREKLSKVQPYTDADEQLWRDCERDIQRHQGQRAELAVRLRGVEQEFKQIDDALKGRERGFRIFEDRKRGLEGVKAALSFYEIRREEWEQRERRRGFWFWAGASSVIVLGISLFGLIFRPSLSLYIAAPLFFIAAIISFISIFQVVLGKARLAGGLERIKSALSAFELGAETIGEINTTIQRFEEGYRREADEIQEMTRKRENLRERIAELKNHLIPSEDTKISDAQRQVDVIQKKSGVDSQDDYRNGLKSKQHYERQLGEARGILLSLFGSRGETVQENIGYWDQEVKALEGYRDRAQGLEHDEGRVTALKKGEGVAEASLAALNDKMVGFRRQLDEIEREVNIILQRESDYVYCKTSIDVTAVHDALYEFMTEYERKKDIAVKVMEIFEAIEAEEKEKVSELFGADSSVARYFADMTGGLYEGVTFNQGAETIEVRRKDGAVLPADKLSGGTYDQLYLAIRLTLGERLLKGARGFFIMDDPFIKADPERLLKQITVLKKIAELGWQVLYFSAKGEVKDILQEEIDSHSINYVEVHARYT